MRFCFHCFTILLLTLFFNGCANSVPSITSVRSILICDFKSESENPNVRLSVFTETDSDLQRVQSLRVENRETGYEWQIFTPLRFESKNIKWAGYSNLSYPEKTEIPSGTYDVFFTDAKGETDKSSFNLSYDTNIYKSHISDFPKILGENYQEIVAVYDKDGVLIYFDDRKENWKTNEDISKEIGDANFLQICFMNSSKTILCLFPKETIGEEN